MAAYLSRNFIPALLLALAACSSAPPQKPPILLERATGLDAQGHLALREGDPVLARNLFEQELRLQQSLDNLPGVAAASVNLATAYHVQGGDDAALRLLDGLLADALTPYPQEMRAAAAFRKSVILLDGGKTDEAATALETALQLCVRQCDLGAGARNVQARIAFARGDYAAALTLAKSAADGAGAQKDELANARRLSGAAEAALGHAELALPHQLAALELDKQLGLTARIAADLASVAQTLQQLGRKDEAAAYARRAAAARAAQPARSARP